MILQIWKYFRRHDATILRKNTKEYSLNVYNKKITTDETVIGVRKAQLECWNRPKQAWMNNMTWHTETIDELLKLNKN